MALLLMIVAVWSNTAHGQEPVPGIGIEVQVNPIMQFYREYISPVDGDRCPMFPSCSHYASDAFKKHGPLMGWIMTCDRLVRCGRDEVSVSGKIIQNEKERCHDPVEANDVWWYKNR